ncbi:MAG: N-6 DNA methylase [Bacteroidaceae bacterium]|nr:N-6 DNA methylase [Bacteroidaceae bacterium]
MNYLQLYRDTLSAVLATRQKDGAIIDPAQTHRLMVTARAYFVVYCYVVSHAYKWGSAMSTLEDCINWIKKNLSPENPFLLVYEQTDGQINSCIEYYLRQIDSESLSCNVGIIYETLLQIDVSGSSVIDGDTSRNSQGSYYTPSKLASYVTESVIANYVENNGFEALGKARILDFSCGSGVFLTEALRSIGKTMRMSKAGLSEFVENLYACDVDFIALEICKFNIMDFIEDIGIYAKLSKNFKHANFLLDTMNEKDNIEKINSYLDGFLYHKDLAIGIDFLSEYDIILGNPPWEKIRFEEKSFYAQYESSIGKLNFKPNLQTGIESAEVSNLLLKNYCQQYRQQIIDTKAFIKVSPRFAASCAGELNTSNLFTEAAYNLMSGKACVGIIIKSSTIATKASKPLFVKICDRIDTVFDFINRKRYFNIDNRERFTLLMMDNKPHQGFRLAMNVHDVDSIEENIVKITKEELHLLNPETEMIPNLSSSKDLPIMLSIYKTFNTIADEFPKLKYGRLVHFTNHATDIEREQGPNNIPVYEGKFFSAFDGMYAGFNHIPETDRYKAKAHARKLSDKEKRNHCYPESRFFIKKRKWKALSATYKDDYMLAWHSLTSATNERACIATILPFMPASQSVQFLTTGSTDALVYLCCLFNSVVFDYIVKNKLTGIDLTQSFIKQIAIPSIDEVKTYVVNYCGKATNVFSLLHDICRTILKDDERLTALWPQNKDLGHILPSGRRDLLVLMDALISLVYQIPEDDLKYIFTSYSNYSASETESIIAQITRLKA